MARLTPMQFANRLALALQPNTLYREAGALRAIRCNPAFRSHPPEAVLAAAWKAGLLKPQPPYPEDFYLCNQELQRIQEPSFSTAL